MNYALMFIIYATTLFLIALEALVLWKIATGKLDLRLLIANEQGDASLSRLQLLIFTFIIAAGFLYLTAKAGAFPAVNESVLVLLGISGTTYALGKALDRNPWGRSGAPPVEPPTAVPIMKTVSEPTHSGSAEVAPPVGKAKAS